MSAAEVRNVILATACIVGCGLAIVAILAGNTPLWIVSGLVGWVAGVVLWFKA